MNKHVKHVYIHTLFRGGHYDSWWGIMTDTIPILKSLLTENPPSPGKVQATPPGSMSPTLFEEWCGFFYVPKEPDKWKSCETGPTAFRSYPRILEAALSSQLFKDPECWSGQGLNPRPPAQQTGALPTELTETRSISNFVIHEVISQEPSRITTSNWYYYSFNSDCLKPHA